MDRFTPQPERLEPILTIYVPHIASRLEDHLAFSSLNSKESAPSATRAKVHGRLYA
jgi:hypothetical protein